MRAKVFGLGAFGNPQYPEHLRKRIESGYTDKRIEPPPAREKELQTLRNIYGDAQSRIYTGASATEEWAKGELNRYRVLHFAAAAVLDDVSPMYSFIALAPGGPNPPDDGLLQNWETLNLNSRANLVVLSAASMNRTTLGAGNASVSTLWSWFVAGTSAVLLGRWRVESPGVAVLMRDFHNSLKSKPSASKTEALRQSALKLRRSGEYAHPYFWSGFALLGDAR